VKFVDKTTTGEQFLYCNDNTKIRAPITRVTFHRITASSLFPKYKRQHKRKFWRNFISFPSIRGTRQRSWLRYYTTRWNVTGSIPDKVTGFFT
jgi:hypothetical protein